ncbi:MAG TPA: type III secretion inner membrane ring lipoprotein SctJ [Burkholderiaceae bacterium]|nr:type III secretion inner membrane ring lipoprotein SctJ [Burkholderiaceae bacterium]
MHARVGRSPGAAARGLRWLAALLLATALAGCKVGLYSDLQEQEANEIVATLTANGLEAHKERSQDGRWQVQVDEGDLALALELLRAQGLPHDRYATMGDLFQKQGLVSTPAEERMRYIYAVSQELSQTLRKVDGVVAARVHVVIPANDPLSDRVRPSSAAVFIKHRPDVDLRLLAPTVKDMVAHSIEGLTHDKVSLSLFEARQAIVTPAQVERRHAPILGVLSTEAAVTLLVLLLAAAACLIALPTLLRRQGLDMQTWLRRHVLRR